MDKSLLIEEGEDRGGVERCGLFVAEVKRLGYIAGPMVAVNLSQYFLQIISIMMVGHLGQLSLSSTAIAISFCAVSGFSLLVSAFPVSVSVRFIFVINFGQPRFMINNI